jgi:hypothetical protein
MNRRLPSLVVIRCATVCLAATAAMGANAAEGYAGIGSTGFEVGYAFKLNPDMGLRADVNFLKCSRDFSTNGADYAASLKFSTLGAFYDYFPSRSFRLTGGLLLGTRKLEGNGVTTGGTMTINGVAYPAPAGEGVSVIDKFPGAAPYLGVGLGHGQSKGGLGFYFDAGAAFGKGDVSLSATPGLVAAAGQANIDAERAKVQDKLSELKVYPVVKFGVSYTY